MEEILSMHFAIILNEFAGSGNAQNIWEKQIKPELEKRQVDYQVKSTQHPGHAEYLAEQYIKYSTDHEHLVILVIGGDGTLHQALNGSMKATEGTNEKIPLAYIPAGSGNDFARGIKMSAKPLIALRQVLDCQKPNTIDIGNFSENIKNETGYFINNIGIGFDAAIVSRTNASAHKKSFNKFHVGSLSYMASIISVLYNQEFFQLMVRIGQHRDLYQNAFLVTTSNHPYFGGGVRILPNANVHSGELELIVIERKNWLILLWLGILLLFKRHLRSHWVHYYKAKEIQVTTTSLEFGQIDGEELGNRFYDLQMKISKYPFWIDTSIK